MGGYVTPTYYCKVCKQIKVWYKFKYGVDESSAICFDCNKKGIDTNEMADRFRLQYRLKKIISAAMKNRMYDLRNHLFETLELVKDGDKNMPIEKAKVICEIAQTLINSAKVEVEYIKAVGGKVTSAFIEMQANGKELPEINIEK